MTEPRRQPPWWLLPLMLACVLMGVLASRGMFLRPTEPAAVDQSPNVLTPSEPASNQAVSLTIDFGNGAQRQFTVLAWHEEMTVAELMAAAARFRPGISWRHVGIGSSALLTTIDGVENEGDSGRNWLYWVNDERADRSFGVYRLEPGNRVLWRFAPPE